MNAKEYEMTDEEYSDLLTEIYGTIDVCGYKHDAGWVLKEIDPIAWDCGKSEQDCGWECGECGVRYEDEDDAEECCKGLINIDQLNRIIGSVK